MCEVRVVPLAQQMRHVQAHALSPLFKIMPLLQVTLHLMAHLALLALQIVVMCNGYRGTFLLGLQRVICMCTDCRKKPEAEREFSCTQYEQHCGAGAAKKWKASLRIEPGSVPEVPEGITTLASIPDNCKLLQNSQLCQCV